MTRLARILCIGIAPLFWHVAPAGAWEVPLTVENAARTGVPPCISGGVPLLPGQAKAPADLHLAVRNAAGELVPIPAQFRVLARHWRADNSIRWALADFASADVPGERKVVVLTDAKLPDAVYRRGEGKEEVLAAGDQGRGLMHIFNGRGGAVLLTRNFWQQFPKAVEAAGDGTLRLGLFPRECVAPHYLDDAVAKGHEIVLHFYRKGKSPFAADGAGRTWPHVFADAWDAPACPRPLLSHIAATGALSDLGPYSVPERGLADYDAAVNLRRLLMTDIYKGNGLGWQVFGERWDSHGGHSTHGARQPIKEDNFLYKWYVTGGAGWLDVGINRSRQFRDVRAYRIDDQDALAFDNWAAFRKANTSESREWTNRPIPNDDELKKYRQGLVPHARWEFPNPEHCTLDLLYDRYLLFGDVRAFENMRVVAGHGGFFAIGYAPAIHRNTGWSWRALERYWELTGDRRAGELLDKAVAAYAPLIGKENLWFSGSVKGNGAWFTQVFSRAAAMAALHTADPKAVDICRALAKGKEDRADYFCALFAALYHLTGEQSYKDAVLGRTDGGSKLLVAAENGEFPCSAHWLATQPPRGRN